MCRARQELEQYARLNDYIASLSPVSDFVPYRIEADQISFKLRLRSNLLALEQLIGLGGVLKKAVAPIPEHGLGEAINDRITRAAKTA